MVSIDLLHGAHCDLSDAAVFGELKGWILGGLVWGVFAGTPCESFSRARRAPPGSRFPGPLRSKEHPRGLPGLDDKDAKRITLANCISDRAHTLLRAAAERGLVGAEENPAYSLLWDLSSRLVQASSDRHRDFFIDHCAFGTPFRARTRIRAFNVGALRTSEALVKARCTGHGICSFTGRRHQWLSGAAASGGVFNTKQKASYPMGLAKTIGAMLADAAEVLAVVARWQVSKG